MAPPRAPADWVDSVLASLSLREKAAQMVWPTVLGDYTSSDSPQWETLRRLIQEERVGGFTVSVGSPVEIAVKLDAMQRASRVPLLFGADFEFGAGYRARGGWFLPNGIDLGGAVVFPPQMALGATSDTALAYDQGRVTATEGRAIGVHVAYAPILDVNNNPANPVINTRSYGEDPALAARLGAAFVRGLQEHGMIATGKHFPGHGDTEVNSHLALPVVGVTRARLDTVELVPFRASVTAGVGAIMTFHGAMPALDSTGAPGTLSKRVLSDLLRGELDFEGVVISDAMDMRGVLDKYGAVEAAIRAVEAGADVLIQPLDARQTIDAVVQGVSSGRYDEARIDASVRRLLEAKRRVGLDRRRSVPIDSIRFVVGDSDHVAVARRVAERSITLVRDSLNQLPLSRLPRSRRVLSITLARRVDLAAGGAFDAELRRHFSTVRSELVNADAPANAEWERLLRVARSSDVVIVSSYVSHAWNAASAEAPKEFANFVKALVAARKRPIVVSLGNPYLLQQIRGVPAYLIAWSGIGASQRAAARALLGTNAITGRLPIRIPPSTSIGAGLMRSADSVSARASGAQR
ncbi:MAG TPA: glycoside hydrolase family 3 N-terminal domain-containing protein [Gemmatimonadaceae bacterium]|nr:glycoside hydrolase family 3 N-terminal domain-containing protein [Gemmatimonadaceae bacterium]